MEKSSKKEFVAQSHWDGGYENLALAPATANDPIRRMLGAILPHESLSCLELGCYPGRYLSVLGGLGYELHGVDLTPMVDIKLPIWLSAQGFKVGSFERADVFEFDPDRKFDVVCSFGLIEHFANWQDLFVRHAELVQPGGYLVVTTPNFRSLVQHALHLALDGVNLKRHNLEAMVPLSWRELAEDLGFEVIQCGGIGRFEFWADHQPRNIAQKGLLWGVRKTRPLWNIVPEGTLSMAPYYAIVARRKALGM
jgi:2-polyprenyl-3-methyl-5-hydroxy-6-metoxy-1,4-benzoquinol methylase